MLHKMGVPKNGCFIRGNPILGHKSTWTVSTAGACSDFLFVLENLPEVLQFFVYKMCQR